MFTAPDADLSDGFFDVLTIGDIGKLDFLRSIPMIYKGTHLAHPKVKMQKACEIEIESTRRMHLQADGEPLGELPARFSVLPSALKVAI
jgi:diacylglycerol kinase family enzyme